MALSLVTCDVFELERSLAYMSWFHIFDEVMSVGDENFFASSAKFFFHTPIPFVRNVIISSKSGAVKRFS